MNNHKSKSVGKTALVLAGGGLTGAVYHIGALRAIDDLLLDRTVNDFDIFVGTSAGSIIASLLASGYSSEEMLQAMVGTNSEIEPIGRKHIFSMDKLELLDWGVNLPRKLSGILYHYIRHVRNLTLFDVLWMMTEALPPGLYDTTGLEKYVSSLLSEAGNKDDFEKLERELYIIATDLNSGERVVFGKGERSETPISRAVAASSALPLFYRPVVIDGCEYVDGGLRGNASLDLAIEQGAKLVVCLNPLVPYEYNVDQDLYDGSITETHLGERGMRSVADQVLRITSHSGLQYHIKQLRRKAPEVDIILIEPRADDYHMFNNNIMKYAARLSVARHGFESVTLDLAEDYAYYKRVLARHGIPISRRLIISELAQIQESGYSTETVRKVLEARSAACTQKKREWPTCQLTRTLAELDLVLDEIEP